MIRSQHLSTVIVSSQLLSCCACFFASLSSLSSNTVDQTSKTLGWLCRMQLGGAAERWRRVGIDGRWALFVRKCEKSGRLLGVDSNRCWAQRVPSDWLVQWGYGDVRSLHLEETTLMFIYNPTLCNAMNEVDCFHLHCWDTIWSCANMQFMRCGRISAGGFLIRHVK